MGPDRIGMERGTFDAAAAAHPLADERTRLVGALVKHYFSSARGANQYVELDQGLAIISQHAQALGYDGVVLFLDELILWLASRSADIRFVNREGPKLAKLVESQSAERPTPLINFVARQRDLKELIGDTVTGAQYLNFSDVLDWWEARFATIKLDDRNLPAIASKRVLKPNSETARRRIDEAFEQTGKIRDEVMRVLLTHESDRAMFRQIYPFSPAFMDTLVAMSFLLQRERTALKVMLQLLIEQKETLQLGQIIPVGDLFDPIAEGDEAVSDEIRQNFINARKLYEEKLRPLLEREHRLTLDEVSKRQAGDPAALNLKNDDRLIKTLLLAALAPNVAALRGITASQLAALNHGAITSPIPGHENQIVLTKCRKWAAEVGQLKIGDEPNNPTIAIHLAGVDTETIIDQAKRFDNDGNRIRAIRKLIFDAFGLGDPDGLFTEYAFEWRHTPRQCRIKFENIRKQALDDFHNEQADWLVMIDYPFDAPGRSPRDDLDKLNIFRRDFPQGARTLVIVPSFLSQTALKALARMVIINNLLKGENLRAYTGHLSANDKQVAQTLLENQQSQLRQQMLNHVAAAYGVSRADAEALDSENQLELSEHFQSLAPGLELKPPTGANLRQTLMHLLDQALAFLFPAHPVFETPLRLTPSVVGKVLDVIAGAAQTKDGRLAVDKPLRKDVRLIANPLKLGSMEETHFILGHFWSDHFIKMQAQTQAALRVDLLRQWIDAPDARGLPRILENLIICAFAVQTDRVFFENERAKEADIGGLPDHWELKTVDLPDEAAWEKALKRAETLWNVNISPLLNAANVSRLTEAVAGAVEATQNDCKALEGTLEQRWAARPELAPAAPRLATARAAQALLTSVRGQKGLALVNALAGWRAPVAPIPTDAALGVGMAKAVEVRDVIKNTRWEMFQSAETLGGELEAQARELKKAINAVLEADELAVSLKPKLRTLETRALGLINTALKPPKPGPKMKKIVHQDSKMVSAQDLEAVFEKIRKMMQTENGDRIELRWTIFK